MLLIDANVILRYLLNDHDEMSQRARETIEQGVYTTTEVLSEVVYVLSGVYKAQRQEIHDWLVCLLDEIAVPNKEATVYALERYGETSLDFIDCILLGYNHVMEQCVFTFDKALNKLLRNS